MKCVVINIGGLFPSKDRRVNPAYFHSMANSISAALRRNDALRIVAVLNGGVFARDFHLAASAFKASKTAKDELMQRATFVSASIFIEALRQHNVDVWPTPPRTLEEVRTAIGLKRVVALGILSPGQSTAQTAVQCADYCSASHAVLGGRLMYAANTGSTDYFQTIEIDKLIEMVKARRKAENGRRSPIEGSEGPESRDLRALDEVALENARDADVTLIISSQGSSYLQSSIECNIDRPGASFVGTIARSVPEGIDSVDHTEPKPKRSVTKTRRNSASPAQSAHNSDGEDEGDSDVPGKNQSRANGHTASQNQNRAQSSDRKANRVPKKNSTNKKKKHVANNGHANGVQKNASAEDSESEINGAAQEEKTTADGRQEDGEKASESSAEEKNGESKKTFRDVLQSKSTEEQEK